LTGYKIQDINLISGEVRIGLPVHYQQEILIEIAKEVHNKLL
jgi:hypothetical protein